MSRILTCRLPTAEADLMVRFAAARKVPMSTLIREALKNEVDGALAAGAEARAR